MLYFFFLTLNIAFSSVVLVPKEGVIPKKKSIEEYAAEPAVGMPEPEVVLRKPKRQEKDRVVQSNAKKKKSKNKKKDTVEPADNYEDLEQIYKQEKEFLESTEVESMPADEGVDPVISEFESPRQVASVSQEDYSAVLREAETTYKKSVFTKIRIQKEVTQELLDRTKNYKGELYLASSGSFKLAIDEPQKSVLLVNDKNVYMLDYPIDEAQNKVQILRSDKPEKLKTEGLLALLVGKKGVSELFKITETKKNKNEITYKLHPKQKNIQVQSVELVLDAEKKQFKTITYWDDLGNRTAYYFKDHTFSEKSPENFFEFKQPDNSSITDL